MDLKSIKATELTLGLPGSDRPAEKQAPLPMPKCGKRPAEESDDADKESVPPPAKAQVVGWPPVHNFRKNCFQAKKTEGEAEGMYVKVSMDGAPYLRKVDLRGYKGYQDLIQALETMFKCFIIGDISGKECSNKPEFALTYEDKDGDWMLVGDVPFGMFTSSCKRLRIMKGSEAQGLESGLGSPR